MIHDKNEMNEIIYYTHSKFCIEQLIEIAELFKNNSNNSNLLIVDLNKHTVSNLDPKSNRLQIVNVTDFNDLVTNVSSYPRFCIYRNGKCIESISGNYENITGIISYYL